MKHRIVQKNRERCVPNNYRNKMKLLFINGCLLGTTQNRVFVFCGCQATLRQDIDENLNS